MPLHAQPSMCSLNLYATLCHSFLNVYVVLKLLDNVGFLTTMNAPSTSQGAPSWEAPDFIHSCNNCKEEAPWRWCETNENGNEGRWMAVCKKFAGKQQVPCNFFCWAWGSTSPSSSPTLGSAQLAPTAVVQPAALSNTTLLLMCAALPQTCLPVPPPPPSQPALILDAAPSDLDVCLSPPLDICLSPPLASLLEVPEPPARVQKGKGWAIELPDASEPVQLPSHMVAGLSQPKARAAPCYAMQMPAIFMQQNACEEEMNEERHQCELERLQAAAQEKNTVVVYAWIQNGVEPIIYEFQDGFKLPNFYFSLSVLHKLCMTSEDPDVPAPARIAPIQRYNQHPQHMDPV
ncbi:uncharacterized protein EDB91DRAFT_1086884 [Suillus paluster]|uniref:uncharacterized protein n=1 Tax=Suillus paluster TaxID=48578 RepID=UPI001B869891|nr:uncharacterized protein EDB91DRAFT_1086884 [Suillus paluster]KAG1726063.1 hypothetical protein EDB91DRAFT_1086884 [Suillus paluster]